MSLLSKLIIKKKYICVGNLQENPMEESTVWVETLHGVYNCYLSRKNAHLGWYLAVKKNGKPKKGKKTWWGQKAIQFLPRPSSPVI
jgi:fibroblast growth factor 1